MTQHLSVDETTEHASRLLKELMSLTLYRSAGETLSIMAESGLSMPQIVVLHMLHQGCQNSISGIADRISLSLAATSHLVDRLVQQGLVVRTEDTTDRRQKRVEITAAGLAIRDRMVQARTRDIAQALAGLPPELSEQLEQVLEQVLQRLKE